MVFFYFNLNSMIGGEVKKDDSNKPIYKIKIIMIN